MIESCTCNCARSSRIAGHFPSDEAAIKLISLALRNINDGKESWRGEKDALSNTLRTPVDENI
jgi:transposase-like protein